MPHTLLALPEYRVLGRPEELEHDLHIRAGVALPKPADCPHCGNTDIYGHGDDVQTGINWQAVFLCAFDPDAIVSVEHDHSCAAFVREPGSDDDV